MIILMNIVSLVNWPLKSPINPELKSQPSTSLKGSLTTTLALTEKAVSYFAQVEVRTHFVLGSTRIRNSFLLSIPPFFLPPSLYPYPSFQCDTLLTSDRSLIPTRT